MTREEAIAVLNGLSDNPLFSTQHKATFNIAIHDIKAFHDWNINNLILVNKDNYEPLEQEPRWIPISERLPEPNANNGLIARYYLIQNEYEDMLVARYDGKGWEQMYKHEYLEDDVIAWMPLPTPYDPQESEE